MREHSINNLDNFIMGWYMQDTNLCDNIVKYFNEPSTHKYKGTVYDREFDGAIPNIKPYDKISTDAKLLDTDLQKQYTKHLQICVDYYIEKYKMCNAYSPWNLTELANIQHYKPGEGFIQWHTERVSAQGTNSTRHLVYMTYLNDVDGGGETEWYYQKIKVKPEKGLTIIWGSDWTFTHRGIPSLSEEKYIVTGWFNYV